MAVIISCEYDYITVAVPLDSIEASNSCEDDYITVAAAIDSIEASNPETNKP